MCRQQDLSRLGSLEGLLSFRLFDVAAHTMGWKALLNHNFGSSQTATLKLDVVDTTPLALMMVSQGLGLAIGHLPVCGPMAGSLGLVTCPLVARTPGPGNYYLEESVSRAQRPSTALLKDALYRAAKLSMRAI